LIDTHPGGIDTDAPLPSGQAWIDPGTNIVIYNLASGFGSAQVRVAYPTSSPPPPTCTLTKPKLSSKGKAKIPKSGKITYSCPGATKLKFKLGGKSKTFKKSKATYTIAKKYRKKKAGTLKITPSGGGFTKSKSYKLKKGVIKG
jgi:hypothetical protein